MKKIKSLYWHLYVVCLPLILVFGCAAALHPDPVHAVGDSISKTGVYVQTAQQDVRLAVPHTDDTGKIHLTNADTHLTSATHELDTAQAELNTARTDINKLTAKSEADQQVIAKYKKQWVGDRTIFWLKAIVAAYVALGVVGIVMSIWAPFPGAAMIGSQILHFLPLANPFVWAGGLVTKFLKPKVPNG